MFVGDEVIHGHRSHISNGSQSEMIHAEVIHTEQCDTTYERTALGLEQFFKKSFGSCDPAELHTGIRSLPLSCSDAFNWIH